MIDSGRALQPRDFGIGRLFWDIHEAVIVSNADTGRIVLWNPAAEALFGYAPAEVVGRPIEMLIPEHLRARLRAGLVRFRVTGRDDLLNSDLEGELPAVHKDGRTLTIELRLSPVDEATGAGRFVLAIVRDATARKRAEEEHLQLAREQAARAEAETARQWFALLAEASGVLASSLELEATLANIARLVVPQFADWCVVDILDEDGQVRPVEVAAHNPEMVPLLRELVARNRRSPGWEHHPTAVALRTGQPQLVVEVPEANLAAIARDDEHLALILGYRPRSVIAVPLTSRGRTLGAISFLATEERPRYAPHDVPMAEELGRRAAGAVEHALLFEQAREAVRAREESLRLTKTITENATLALFMMDDHQRCTFMNPAVEQMTGFTLAEVQGLDRPLHDLVHHTRPDGSTFPPAECPIYRALGQAEQVRGEELFVRRDGSLYPVAFTASPIIREGRPVGTVVEARDITAEKRAEAERAELLARERTAREQAEAAVRGRDEFLSIAAHELKTPMTSLWGAVQLLLRRLDSKGALNPAHTRVAVEVVSRQVQKLAHLVDQLLDISRLDSGKLRLERQQTDLRHLAETAAEAARVRTSLHSISVRGAAVEVLADPLRLEQVLTNLLDNAIKYSPAGGPVVVSVLAPEAGRVELAVRDRGLGIPPEKRAHIFERFYQAHLDEQASGMGLGLYICRQIVELHGGELRAEFPDDGGTRFFIRLPVGPVTLRGAPRPRSDGHDNG
ncbi:MAG: PAS domain S-box protein [Chloroflexota bacterium]|nr:PAS domain S-box protein [Chloroflexota bacterium]